MKFTAALLMLALAPAIALSAPATEENAAGKPKPKPKPDPIPTLVWGASFDNQNCFKSRYTRTYQSPGTKNSIALYPGVKGFINNIQVVLYEDKYCRGNGVKADLGGCANLGGKEIRCITKYVNPPSE